MKHTVHQHFVIGCVLAVVGGVVVWTRFVCNTFACIPAGPDRRGGGKRSRQSAGRRGGRRGLCHQQQAGPGFGKRGRRP